MDGFNVIPVQKDTFKNVAPGQAAAPGAAPNTFDSNFEIIDEEKEKQKALDAAGVGWFLVISIFSLVGVFSYFVFLVFQRINMLSQIQSYSQELQKIGQNIDQKEMQEFRAMDNTLKVINGKIDNHVLNSYVFNMVNQNIRKTLQITEYRLEVKDKTVEVNLSALSPSFKELAEQTEKLFAMKERADIMSFTITNLSFEAETKRVRFSILLVFDKSKMTANKLTSHSQN